MIRLYKERIERKRVLLLTIDHGLVQLVILLDCLTSNTLTLLRNGNGRVPLTSSLSIFVHNLHIMKSTYSGDDDEKVYYSATK